jgi:hypothetical protein
LLGVDKQKMSNLAKFRLPLGNVESGSSGAFGGDGRNQGLSVGLECAQCVGKVLEGGYITVLRYCASASS